MTSFSERDNTQEAPRVPNCSWLPIILLPNLFVVFFGVVNIPLTVPRVAELAGREQGGARLEGTTALLLW